MKGLGFNHQFLRPGWRAICDGRVKLKCTNAQFEHWFSMGTQRWAWFDVTHGRHAELKKVSELWGVLADPRTGAVDQENFDSLIAMLGQAMPDRVGPCQEYSPKITNRDMTYAD